MEYQIGGNTIRKFDLKSSGRHNFATDPYHYYHQIIPPGETIKIPKTALRTIYVIKSRQGAVIRYDGKEVKLDEASVINCEGTDAEISAGNNPLELFIAGVDKSRPARVEVLLDSQVKIVTKPWGYEMWLNGEHPEYAFKKIFLKSGSKTSLQYHRIKRETNLIFDGKAILHFKQNNNAGNDEVKAQDIAQHTLSAGEALDVFPNNLHRIEALTDLYLFEVSTPHLNDVVRVLDDTNRPDGRINSEHR